MRKGLPFRRYALEEIRGYASEDEARPQNKNGLVGKAKPFRTSGGKAANAMREDKKTAEPLPESFESEEAAGEFWDTHSLPDYEEHLEAANDVLSKSASVCSRVQVAEDVSGNRKSRLLRNTA